MWEFDFGIQPDSFRSAKIGMCYNNKSTIPWPPLPFTTSVVRWTSDGDAMRWAQSNYLVHFFIFVHPTWSGGRPRGCVCVSNAVRSGKRPRANTTYTQLVAHFKLLFEFIRCFFFLGVVSHSTTSSLHFLFNPFSICFVAVRAIDDWHASMLTSDCTCDGVFGFGFCGFSFRLNCALLCLVPNGSSRETPRQQANEQTNERCI